MAETAQIAEIAQIVSDTIFKYFGWERAGTSDHNFKGAIITSPENATDETEDDEEIKPAANLPASSETRAAEPPSNAAPLLRDYPADVVFYYENPYYDVRQYIHFDLKSYASNSLKGSKIRNALRSLAQVIKIAELSEDWGRKFAPNQSNYKIQGGLFVYNHDNQGRGRFQEFFAKMTHASAKIPEGHRIYVFSPERIIYLLSLIHDLKSLRADGIVPLASEGEILFFYPYGVKVKARDNLLSYATAEMLLGPLLIVRYRYNNQTKPGGYIVYYDGPGASVDEFLFIFETLLKRRLLTDVDQLHLRLQNPADNAFGVFKSAKEDFVKAYHDLPSFRKQVDQIQYGRGARVTLEFSTVELGME